MAATFAPDDPPTEDKDVVDEFNEEARAVLLETGLLGLPWSVLPEVTLFCLVLLSVLSSNRHYFEFLNRDSTEHIGHDATSVHIL